MKINPDCANACQNELFFQENNVFLQNIRILLPAKKDPIGNKIMYEILFGIQEVRTKYRIIRLEVIFQAKLAMIYGMRSANPWSNSGVEST